jgi:hypothetical protein
MAIAFLLFGAFLGFQAKGFWDYFRNLQQRRKSDVSYATLVRAGKVEESLSEKEFDLVKRHIHDIKEFI